MADETYYSLLEVSEVATATEIKSAYIRLIREVHPDRLANAPAYWQRQAEEKAKEVNEAYTVLSDREKRRLYDAQLASYRSAQATSSGPSSVHQSSPNTAQQQTPPRPPRPAQARQQAQQQPPQAATTQAAQQGQISSSFKAWFWIVWAAWSVVCLVNSNAWMIIVGLPASLFIGTYLEKAQRFVEHRLGIKPRPQQPATGPKVPGGP
jgi:curved DNA-binding protein CbpA